MNKYQLSRQGLYSKAAKIISGLKQERGTADQFIGAAGLRDTPEIKHAGELPSGTLTRDELARFFKSRLPVVTVDQYGENPDMLAPYERAKYRELSKKQQDSFYRNGEQLTPDEQAHLQSLYDRHIANQGHLETEPEYEDEDPEPLDTNYDDYKFPGMQSYRERLISLKRPTGKSSLVYQVHTSSNGVMPVDHSDRDEAEAHKESWERDNPGERAVVIQKRIPSRENFWSSHWSGHPDVIAHLRLGDRQIGEDRESLRPVAEKLAEGLGIGIRDLASGAVSVGIQRGVITPQEGASLSRLMKWRNGYDQGRGIGKRLLHVDEIQSDWGQEGRDKGFYDPQNPHEIFNTKTGETISRHPTHAAMWDAFRAIPEEEARGLDYGHAADSGKVPSGPYVENTNHWTDLALKNVLREAALGNYDGIVFTPGQAQADRYGLQKQLSRMQLVRQPGDNKLGALHMWDRDGDKVNPVDVTDEKHLTQLIGAGMAQKLLSSEDQSLEGDDLKMGGHGMIGYYDKRLPANVMKLARMHDKNAQFGEPINLTGEDGQQYQGMHLPMSDEMKQSILNEGFPAMRRGGSVTVQAALAKTRK